MRDIYNNANKTTKPECRIEEGPDDDNDDNDDNNDNDDDNEDIIILLFLFPCLC